MLRNMPFCLFDCLLACVELWQAFWPAGQTLILSHHSSLFTFFRRAVHLSFHVDSVHLFLFLLDWSPSLGQVGVWRLDAQYGRSVCPLYDAQTGRSTVDSRFLVVQTMVSYQMVSAVLSLLHPQAIVIGIRQFFEQRTRHKHFNHHGHDDTRRWFRLHVDVDVDVDNNGDMWSGCRTTSNVW